MSQNERNSIIPDSSALEIKTMPDKKTLNKGSSNMRTFKHLVVAMTAGSLTLSASAETKMPKELPAKQVQSQPELPTSDVPGATAGTNVKTSPKQNSAPAEPITIETAYVNAYQDEVNELKRTEELEKKAAKAQKADEEKKAELEKEIAAKKFQIQSYKVRQDRANNEMLNSRAGLDGLTTELATAEQELASFRQSAEHQLTQADQQKSEYTAAQKKLSDTQDRLRSTKVSLTKALYDGKMEVQKLKTDVAQAEAKVEALEAQNSNLKADAAGVNLQLMAIRTAIDDRRLEIAKANSDLEQTRKGLEKAKVDLAESNIEFKKVEAKKLETDNRVTAEVKRLEETTVAAQKSKTINESEKLRIEAETEKMKNYLASVKRVSSEAIDASIDSQSSVMESRLALQTAKSELGQQVAKSDGLASKKDANSAKIRRLASVAEASDILDGAKPWVMSKSCKLHKRASSSSEVLQADLNLGQKLIGADYSEHWIKVLNSSGAPAFIKKDCGSFE